MYKDFYKIISEGYSDTYINLLKGKSKLAIEKNSKFIFAGNGGSMAIANHISAELTGRFVKDRPPIKSYVLGTNQSSSTAIANDYSYSEIFVRELNCFIEQDDVLILMSTSGRSKNILRCIDYVNEIKHVNTFLLTGNIDKEYSEFIHHIQSPSTVTARIQEHHLIVLHEMCEYIDSLY